MEKPNFRYYLNDIFNNTKITDLIGDNFYMLKKPESIDCDMWIEYEIVDVERSYFGDTKGIEIYQVQVVVISKNNFVDLQEAVEEVMELNGFTHISSYDYYNAKDDTFNNLTDWEKVY